MFYVEIMLTTSGASVCRCRDATIGPIELLEPRPVVLEHKESLIEDDRQSGMRMNGLLRRTNVTADFKNYIILH